MEVRFFTTQGSSTALQGDLPGEVISSGLLCLQLFLGARKHIPPKQQHLRQVVAHKGGAWAQTECGVCAISKGVSLLNQKLAQRQDTDLPRVMRAPSSSQPACVRCKDSRLFCAAVRKRSSAILTTSYKQRTHTVSACKLAWTLTQACAEVQDMNNINKGERGRGITSRGYTPCPWSGEYPADTGARLPAERPSQSCSRLQPQVNSSGC